MIKKVARIVAPTLLFSPSLLTSIARHFLSTYYKNYKYYIFVEEIFTRTCFFDFVANSQKCLFGKIKLRPENCQNKVN